ncbi:Na+:solute symporter [candidate division KSB1 bacterium]|nr:Na+:solute symporter [candidate division KSB1 bacterium]NIR71708.1 Na+:solute symporter [candidate division KSB1 bacterium]NIS28255.1 Na+:solute symporter [candidate division KSB1 bacterium]NIT70385.1 Na+:solute symporter [candidate division KSB1 bacterium]NIU28933.1 Na+:solute symporter [candidate division KSB1 bacterium]
MQLALLDWIIISLYMVFAIGVGVFFSKRAGKNITEYFISGRNLPWWIAGTSMVATTFAADTPLFVSGVIAKEGIAGNWLWWNLAASHVMATIFFARLWHRADILTDLELLKIRYSGRPAKFLRGFRSLWEGILLNCIIMGWVMLAMFKILGVFVDWPKWWSLGILLVIAITYTILSGFWGVVITDIVQFVIAMSSSVILAVIVVYENGGMTAIQADLRMIYADKAEQILSFVPEVGSAFLPVTTFIAFIAVNWWAVKIADGGSYIAQRMFAARDEKHSFLATLWFTVAHYCLRPWPWILVGIAAMVVYPDLQDPELGYPKMVAEYLPAGLLGLMLVSFLAAFMSTIDTQVNWGTSILVNDFYKAFVRPNHTDTHYVLISRIVTLTLLILGTITAALMQTIKGAWELFYGMSAGIGGVYIARWFWWRVNAWSEITAWLSSAIAYSVLYFINKFHPTEFYSVFGWRLIIVTGFSTACWLMATFLTRPVSEEKLIAFYQKVRPGSPFWKPIANKAKDVKIDKFGWGDILAWLSGILVVYSFLFGTGKIILGSFYTGLFYFIIGILAGYFIHRHFNKKGWETLVQ